MSETAKPNTPRLRGYIGSRPYFGDRAPQHVQNLVVRDYCNRIGGQYYLSATEYIMNGCYMMLEETLREFPNIDGIVLYSIYMLPKREERRRQVYDRIFAAGGSLHGAVENIALWSPSDISGVEDLWRTKLVTGGTADPDVVAAVTHGPGSGN